MLSSTAFRPPAVPLITSDPYLDIYSESTNLTDTDTVSWTGEQQSLVSLIRIDGVSYRLMGDDPSTVPAFPQVDVTVLPTRSIYDFDNGHVHVTMTFMQPAIASNLTAFDLPLSYITWQVSSDDGSTHSVQIYDSTSSELAVNSSSQVVTWQRGSTDGMTTLDIGTTAQTYFVPSGDPVNIDWGYAYTAASASQSTSSIGYDTTEINTFESAGLLPNTDDPVVPRAVSNNQPVMAYAFNLGNINSVVLSRHVIVAYDEVYSVDYFGDYLTPYWERNGTTVQQMLTQAQNDYGLYTNQCASFDAQLMDDLTTIGGSQYAAIAALSYRQSFSSMGLSADANGQPLLFTKEDTSNGDIATTDVVFPTFPILLLFSPTLAKAALQTLMEYADSSQWTYAYAPHDLGTYPDAVGDPSGSDGNEQMPVEESADMLIMFDAVAQEEGNTEYANHYWPLLSSWASYLVPYANTPGEQLTTNDFLGTLDNSTNLAVKAIVALGAYANMCAMRGDPTDAATYNTDAATDVTHWMSQSISSDGTHWLFEYGDQGTGVQLYNLAMDQILGLNLFPKSVEAMDISYAEANAGTYGTPIASVTTRTSIQWSVWEASMATNPSDFQTLVSPIYNYLNTTTDLVPESDIHTDNGNGSTSSFADARSVIGGVFVELLTNRAMWEKYSSQDTTVLNTYAPFPGESAASVSSPAPAPVTVSAGQTVGPGDLSGATAPTSVTLASLTIPGNTNGWQGQLDIGGDEVVVQNGNLARITNQIAGGYDLTAGGTWTGQGITSSLAAADTSHLTAVGVELNNNGSGAPVFGVGTSQGLFGIQNPGPNDVLIKYTYFGDANLDGKVDGSDYSIIDNGYENHLTGWGNGDFNYDGVIDGSDYALMDNAFNNQGTAITVADVVARADVSETAGAVAAVPAAVVARTATPVSTRVSPGAAPGKVRTSGFVPPANTVLATVPAAAFAGENPLSTELFNRRADLLQPQPSDAGTV